MGYYSYGSGTFTLRPGVSKEQADEFLSKNGFQYDILPNDKYTITFSELKLYHAGKMMKELAEHFNGEFEISGEDLHDFSKLILRDGKAYTAAGRIEYGPEEETDLDGWN